MALKLPVWPLHGNATEPIKALADVIVADCDHNGCAEAIDKYLLAD